MRSALAPLAWSCLALLGVLPSTALACATCGCTLSTDAATGYSSQPGWRITVESVYLDQEQLRHGSHAASSNDVLDHPVDPAADGAEIERDTRNRYDNLSVSYRPNADWAVGLLLPYVQRDHTTYGEQEAPFTPAAIAPDQVSQANVSGLGDARIIASYQGFLPTHNLGMQVGVKLPTGRYGGQNEVTGERAGHPVTFDRGPMVGDALDASLQAGTGSTDLIVGGYYFQPVSQDFDLVVDGQFQTAIAHRLDAGDADFRPGNEATLNLGLRYEAHAKWVPQLQLNLLRRSADQGALADRLNTAGTVAYLAPGISAGIGRNVQVYGFAQIPVYSHLSGYQLFPRWTATVGMSVGF
ncbi:transporter [Cognatiluteimonas profundi]|uniref:transporter n=1 Tax=Cognatiluteimonas profundi TaxID=2594501 RepID=UPI00131E84AE|nr:transporter [Lysobacter profundi]